MSIIWWCFRQILSVVFIAVLSVTVTLWLIGGYIHQVLPEWKPLQELPWSWVERSWDVLLGPEASTSLPAMGSSTISTPEGSVSSTTPALLLTSDHDNKSSENAYYVWREGEALAQAQSVDSLLLSMEQVEAQRNQLTSKEKMDIFSILISKIPQLEVEAMWAKIVDGVTELEAQQIQETLKKYLNEQEYQMIEELIRKYQG